MPKTRKTRAELEEIVRSRAALTIGPWPRGMSLHIYAFDDTWSAMFGYSDPAQTDFRDRALALVHELRQTHDLIGSN